jgi:hypothetical protein
MLGVREALFYDLANPHMRKALHKKQRGETALINSGASPYVFKKFVQLQNFDKRIIWAQDRSFDELSEEAIAAFKDSQTRFLLPEPMTLRASLVIQRAREICAEILGEFDWDHWSKSCCFGKRAAVGLPRREAYLDTRFTRISGTPTQLATFNYMLSRDIHLLRAVRKRCRQRKCVDTISVTTVPKSFKAARVIAPDTILGGFLSRGLGDYIRKRLETKTHIDLSKQQERHRRWIRTASKTGHLGTIDMSKASDSFTWRHIELLVPFSWHHALQVCHTNNCNVGDGLIPLASYMLMGSGHTFPLQTVLFYCLAEAVRTLLRKRGKVSVYGDDIIVPVRVASPFIVVMSELGFTVNSEKSFYDLPDPDRPSQTFFRESCGGDYKGGIDVRPYMPECNLQELKDVPRNLYIAWCHKIINGLLDRWDPCEVPFALGFVLREICNQNRKICFVPSYEVDHAGIKHYIPEAYLLGLEFERPTFERNVPTYRKLVYVQKTRKRGIDERPYYWYKLHTSQRGVEPDPLYDSSVSLSGENRKDIQGTYRWKVSTSSSGDTLSRKDKPLIATADLQGSQFTRVEKRSHPVRRRAGEGDLMSLYAGCLQQLLEQ